MIFTLPTFFIWMLTALIPILHQTTDRSLRTLIVSVYSSKESPYPSQKESTVRGFARSTDEGKSWSSLGWKNASTNSFCFHAADSNRVLLASDYGIFEARIDAHSIKLLSPWNLTMAKQIAMHPKNPTRIVAATALGIFVSTDDGNSWNESSDGLPLTDGTFVSCIRFPNENPNDILIGSEAGLFRSNDGGAHWKPGGLVGKKVRSIERHPGNNDLIVCATATNGVYISTDGGMNWEEKHTGLPTLQMTAAYIDPSNERTLYALSPGYGVLQSTDQGKSWNLRSRGLTNLQSTALCVDPHDSKTIFLATRNGIFVSRDGVQSWKAHSLSLAHVSSILIH